MMPKRSVAVKKKPCTVINAPCKHYIPKKSRELLKEDSCRNLIQYVKLKEHYMVVVLFMLLIKIIDYIEKDI